MTPWTNGTLNYHFQSHHKQEYSSVLSPAN
uniref:Uncharacterized protein n=1 Tax=Arundo donax TaxID=35708 RepID=A0A0A9HPQ0_ARUDO